MPTSDTFKWERDVIGEHIVYPSHPLIVACMIMDRYQNFEHAIRRRENNDFRNASRDSFIPGSGCAVACGLRVLELSLKGLTAEAIKMAHEYIESYRQQSACNDAGATIAQAQSERIKGRFNAHVAAWGTPDMPASDFRFAEGENVS